MKHVFLMTTLAFTTLLLAGCLAAPGSATMQTSVSGQVVDTQGQALAKKSVEIAVTNKWGSGMDDWDGNTSWERVRAQLRTDADGQFNHLFERTIYGIAFFIMPPIGDIPRNPPVPWFVIRTDSTAPDFLPLDRKGKKLVVRKSVQAALPNAPTITGNLVLRNDDDKTMRYRGWHADLLIVEGEERKK